MKQSVNESNHMANNTILYMALKSLHHSAYTISFLTLVLDQGDFYIGKKNQWITKLEIKFKKLQIRKNRILKSGQHIDHILRKRSSIRPDTQRSVRNQISYHIFKNRSGKQTIFSKFGKLLPSLYKPLQSNNKTVPFKLSLS